MTENPGAEAASAQVGRRVALGCLNNVAAGGGRLGAPDAVRTYGMVLALRDISGFMSKSADRLLTWLVRPAFEHPCSSGRATARRLIWLEL